MPAGDHSRPQPLAGELRTLDTMAQTIAHSDVELLGLSVLLDVMERMTVDERRRALRYLNDRYGPGDRWAGRFEREALREPGAAT